MSETAETEAEKYPDNAAPLIREKAKVTQGESSLSFRERPGESLCSDSSFR